MRLLSFTAFPNKFAKLFETAASIVTVLSVVVSATVYFLEIPDRDRASVLRAWNILAGMDGKRASGGRPEALRQLKASGESLAGVVLDNAILEGIDLSEMKLSYGSLRNVQFSRCSFKDSNLDFVDFSGGLHRNKGDFRGAHLEKVVLAGTALTDCACDKLYLHQAKGDSGTSFNGAALNDASILHSELIGTNFDNASLSRSLLYQTDVGDASFQRADVSGSRWITVRAAGARFQKLVGNEAYFGKDTNLSMSRFDQSHIRDGIFDAVLLNGASFFGADLSHTVFRGCDLSGADFTSANLTGVRFEHCKIEGTIFRNSIMGRQNVFTSCEGVPLELPEGSIK